MPLTQEEHEALREINANRLSPHKHVIKSLRERKLIVPGTTGSFLITPTGLRKMMQATTMKKESK